MIGSRAADTDYIDFVSIPLIGRPVRKNGRHREKDRRDKDDGRDGPGFQRDAHVTVVAVLDLYRHFSRMEQFPPTLIGALPGHKLPKQGKAARQG
ncbi:MAG TPA: hypothetical protein VG848_12885 [Acetobacteraceae bacterium]|nr:hypothetical protein [Acetobacteraceae bacterium]